MPLDVAIYRIRDHEWEAFRDLRLEALRTDPLAFGSTFDRESGYPQSRWESWCRDGATGEQNATFVAADPSAGLVGMIGAFVADGTPHVWGMWTRPEWRGRGIGRQLLDSLLDWLHQNVPGRPVLLEVNPSQAVAVRMYSSVGFQFTGVEKPLGHDPPEGVREMVRRAWLASEPRP